MPALVTKSAALIAARADHDLAAATNVEAIQVWLAAAGMAAQNSYIHSLEGHPQLLQGRFIRAFTTPPAEQGDWQHKREREKRRNHSTDAMQI